MTTLTFKTSSGTTIVVNGTQKLGKAGGEGTVYPIVSPSKYKDFCVKVYHDRILNNPQDIQKRKEKIEYMVRHSIVSQNPNVRICAPYELVFSNNQFIGFIMPKAFDDNLPLTTLVFDYDLSASKYFQELSGFDGQAGLKAVYNRLVIANNIAYAIAVLHQTGHYVLVDIKPENILITAQGKVSLIDIDSVQIVDGRGKLLFPASAWTENYRPPEAKRIQKGTNIIAPTWDSFSFGILAYEVIIGCHPYSGTYRAPYDKGHDTVYCIDNGLFLQGSKQAYLANPGGLKKFFDRYAAMPKPLRQTFVRAFEDGHYNIQKRPTMTEWGNAFHHAIQEIHKSLAVPISQQGGGLGKSVSGSQSVVPVPPQPVIKSKNIGWIVLWVLFAICIGMMLLAGLMALFTKVLG